MGGLNNKRKRIVNIPLAAHDTQLLEEEMARQSHLHLYISSGPTWFFYYNIRNKIIKLGIHNVIVIDEDEKSLVIKEFKRRGSKQNDRLVGKNRHVVI